MSTDQIKTWTGEFGRAYTDRNRFETLDEINAFYATRFGRSRDDLNRDWLGFLPRETRVLEVGANVGNQLRALQHIGFRDLHGIEIQRRCVEEAERLKPGIDIVEGSGFEIPFPAASFDLVFTSGVLIHIAPDDLPRIMGEIYRVSRRYIFGLEYYAPQTQEILYRNQSGLLWKGDYAALYGRQFPDLKLLREERLPYRDDSGNVDQLFLLEKPGLEKPMSGKAL